MTENSPKKAGIPEIARYRKDLAQRLLDMGYSSPAARDHLQTIRESPTYQIAHSLTRNPAQLIAVHGLAVADQLRGREEEDFGYYTSNEYYAGLAISLQNLGGVGLVVGSDQPLDFFTMANLRQVYAVDIDPHTHLITQSYLEVGTRFRQLLSQYPTTDEYLSLFDGNNRDVLLGLLAAPTAGHNFSQEDIDWLRNRYKETNFGDYLSQKKRFYGSASWIGSDQNLADVIRAYEQGRVIICKGSITGDLLPTINKKVEKDEEYITLIYTSNAPIKNDTTLEAFKNLRITDNTVVVFSDLNYNERNQIPVDYSFAMGRNHYLFSPNEHSFWPSRYLSEEYLRFGSKGTSHFYLRPVV